MALREGGPTAINDRRPRSGRVSNRADPEIRSQSGDPVWRDHIPNRPHSATAHPPPHVQILVVTGLPLQPLSSNARVDSERQNDTTTSFGSSVPLRATSSVLAHRPQSSPPPPLPCWRTTCPHASTDHPRSRCARAHPGSCRPEQHSSPGLAPKRRRCGVHLQFTLRDSTPPEEASESSAARR
jgi:hypothetical protein